MHGNIANIRGSSRVSTGDALCPLHIYLLALEYRQVTAEQTAGTPAIVKWFNPTKGFGFVTAGDARSDALLHASVLAKLGRRWLQEGTKVEVILEEGPKGLVVSELISIDDSAFPEEDLSGVDWIEAEVKFFNFSKGYGFAVVTLGNAEEQDVFGPFDKLPPELSQ